MGILEGSETGHGGRRRRRRRGRCRFPLSEGLAGERYTILSNPDRQTLEMGVFHGASVQVIQNHAEQGKMVIGVGDSRFMLDKHIADDIMVA